MAFTVNLLVSLQPCTNREGIFGAPELTYKFGRGEVEEVKTPVTCRESNFIASGLWPGG